MNRTCKHAALAVGLVTAGVVLAPGGANAQVSWTSAGEIGGDEVNLIYTSLGWSPGWMGARPTLGVSAYRVGYPGGSTYSFGPSAGLEYRAEGGSVEASVGYAFKSDDAADFFGGSDEGVTSGLHGEYWGDGSMGLQAILSYNWGSEFLWSRARATRRVAQPAAGGAVNLGAELGWQGDTSDEIGAYQAVQWGPVVQWITPGDMIFALSGGVKDLKTGADDTWYAKVEFTITP